MPNDKLRELPALESIYVLGYHISTTYWGVYCNVSTYAGAHSHGYIAPWGTVNPHKLYREIAKLWKFKRHEFRPYSDGVGPDVFRFHSGPVQIDIACKEARDLFARYGTDGVRPKSRDEF